MRLLENTSVNPEQVNGLLDAMETTRISQKVKAIDLLMRPQVSLAKLIEAVPQLGPISQNDREFIEQAEIQVKYDSYIEKEREMAGRMQRLEEVPIALNFDFSGIRALSNEAREKLSEVRPRTVGQASRISGVNPADVSILLVQLGR